MAITQEARISVAPTDHGVLIFHTWKNKIPEGIQVLHACGGTSAPTTPPTPKDASSWLETLKNVRLGIDSFLKMCSIKSVTMSEGQIGYCRVYVNWEVNPGQPGWNAWGVEGNMYKPFLRSLFGETYKNVKIRLEGQKTSLCFSDKRADRPVETKIVFVGVTDSQKLTAAAN